MSPRAHDVCAATVSDLPFDARVWKEARSLAASGRSVALVGCRYEIPKLGRRREAGVDVVEVPFGTRRGRVSLPGRLVVLLRLWWETLRISAAAYHAHNVEAAPAAWLASRVRGARLVYDAHELYAEAGGSGLRARLARLVTGSLERFMVQRSDAVITTNQSRADALGDRYGRNGIVVLANVPTRCDDLRALDPGYPSDKPVLLYQGHVSADGRAFRETLEAMTTVEEVEFVILGFARQARLDMINRWATELGVAERVHLLPPRPFDELVRTAAAATVGLVPIYPITLNEYLGDTNKIFEYLMAGIPVIASDLPEIRKVATSGRPQVGELFDPYSADSVAQALRRVLDSPATYGERCREARRLALEHYNWSVEEPRLLGLYSGLSA
jgi:glycosyltransferase involved in cell wall biosynthesis